MTTPPNDPFNQGQPDGQQPQYGQQPEGQYGYQQPGAYGQQPGSYGQQPGAYGQPAAAYGAPQQPQSLDRGSFFSALFDFKFDKMVATRVIPVLYLIITIVFTIFAVFAFFAGIIAGFAAMGDSVGGGLVTLIGTIILVPLVYLIYLTIARVSLELYISVFKISQNTAQIAQNTAK